MSLDSRKLQLIHWMIVTQNEQVIKDIENLRNEYQQSNYEAELKPMDIAELTQMISDSENDIKNGKVYLQEEVISYFAMKNEKNKLD